MNRTELAGTAAWLDTLYSRCTEDDGHLIFVAPCKRKVFGRACKIGSQDALVAAAKSVCGFPGLYLKINPMDADAMRERSRREGKGRYIVGNISEVKTVVSFHLDVDAGKSNIYLSREQTLRALDKMPCKPTLIVNSDGEEGGLHVYWVLRQPHRIATDDDGKERKHIAASAARWQGRLRDLIAAEGGKLDSTANLDRVLRVVGGQRSNGNRVSCHSYHPDRLYTLDDLYLPPSKEAIKERVKWDARRIVTDALGEVDSPSNRPITQYIDAARIGPEDLLREHGYTRISSDEYLRPDSETGARTLKLSSGTDRPGINVFSGGDPNFDCLKDDGQVGRYHSVDAMFVTLRFGGDWGAASTFCKNEITRRLMKRK